MTSPFLDRPIRSLEQYRADRARRAAARRPVKKAPPLAPLSHETGWRLVMTQMCITSGLRMRRGAAFNFKGRGKI